MPWPVPALLSSEHLLLEPLTLEHAPEMLDVLSAPSIYEYTGGEPPSLDDLHSRYARQIVGHSTDGSQGWMNWVIRREDSGEAVGFIQATIEEENGLLAAEVAWMVAPRHQRQGFASEAAIEATQWLREQGVQQLVAHVHPKHAASAMTAKRLGLHATGREVHGETRWES